VRSSGTRVMASLNRQLFANLRHFEEVAPGAVMQWWIMLAREKGRARRKFQATLLDICFFRVPQSRMWRPRRPGLPGAGAITRGNERVEPGVSQLATSLDDLSTRSECGSIAAVPTQTGDNCTRTGDPQE